MPTTPTVPRPSPTAARAAAVPFLPTARSRTRRGGLRGPAYGGHPTHRRGRSSAALDLAPPGRLDARALWVGVLSRDDPRGPAPPQALVEESQEAARPGRPREKAGVHRAAPGLAGRRPTRPAAAGLCGWRAHPPGWRSRVRLGRARRALLGRLPHAGPVGARLG